MKNELKNPVILFDGLCNLCNATVNYLIRLDKKRIFRYSHLQSDTGRRFIQSFKISSPDYDSVILILDNRLLIKSSAALEIMKILGGGWRFLGILKIVPLKLRDTFYDFVARNRYKWFGRNETCIVPNPALKELFID